MSQALAQSRLYEGAGREDSRVAFRNDAAQAEIRLADAVVAVRRIRATRGEQHQAKDKVRAHHRAVGPEQFRIGVLAKQPGWDSLVAVDPDRVSRKRAFT